MNSDVPQFFLKRKIQYPERIFRMVSDYLIFCYFKLLTSKIVYSKEYISKHTSTPIENFLRDRFLYEFIQKSKKEYRLVNPDYYKVIANFLYFAEVQTLFHKEAKLRASKIDIFVTNLSNELLGKNVVEQIYFDFECKRLNKNLKKEYVSHGIERYLERDFENGFPFTGMIGFVEDGSIDQIVNDINIILKKQKKSTFSNIEYLKYVKLNNSFKKSYKSKHLKSNSSEFSIYHLLFDYSNILSY